MKKRFSWDLVLVGAMFAASVVVFGVAPDRMPIHFGLTGSADDFASKAFALFFAPFLSLLMTGLFRLAPRWRPFPDKPVDFGLVSLVSIGFLGFVHATIIVVGLRGSGELPRTFFVGLCVFFIVIGEMLPGFQPNYLAGIRLPWTLRNRETWRRTHEASRWLMDAGGVGGILCSLFNWLPGVMAFLVVSSLATIPLSYLIHQRVLREDTAGHHDAPYSWHVQLAVFLGYGALGVLAVCLLVVALLGFSVASARKPLWSLTQELVACLDQGQYEEAESLFSPELQRAMDSDSLRLVHSQISEGWGRRTAVRWGGVFLLVRLSPLSYVTTWILDYENEKGIQCTLSFEKTEDSYKVAGLFFNSRKSRERPLMVRTTLCTEVQKDGTLEASNALSLVQKQWCLFTEWQGLKEGSVVDFTWTDPEGNVVGPWAYPVPKDGPKRVRKVWSCVDWSQFPIVLTPGTWTVLVNVDGKKIVTLPIPVAEDAEAGNASSTPSP